MELGLYRAFCNEIVEIESFVKHYKTFEEFVVYKRNNVRLIMPVEEFMSTGIDNESKTISKFTKLTPQERTDYYKEKYYKGKKIFQISNDEDHKEALHELQDLWNCEEGTEDGYRFEELACLISEYEKIKFPLIEVKPTLEEVKLSLEKTKLPIKETKLNQTGKFMNKLNQVGKILNRIKVKGN